MSRHACQRQKTLMLCGDTDKAHHVAAKLGATVAPDCLEACGTALGHARFIEEHDQHRCDRTCEQAEKLAGLPLDPQTKWRVLRKCLEHREAHVRGCLWVFLAQPLRHVEDALQQRICDIVGVPQLTARQREQAVLPPRHGGMGVRCFSKDVATAARLSPSSAALACAATANGSLSGKGNSFRGAVVLDADAAAESLCRSWPSVKYHAGSPDDPEEWAHSSRKDSAGGRPSTCSDTCRRICAHCGCDRGALGGRGRAGIPAAGSGPLRHGTPEKLRRGFVVGLADGSAGSHGAHGC